MEFLYLSGWRIGEAINLKWSAVDLEGKTVRLRIAHSKNKDSRLLPLTGRLWECVRRLVLIALMSSIVTENRSRIATTLGEAHVSTPGLDGWSNKRVAKTNISVLFPMISSDVQSET